MLASRRAIGLGLIATLVVACGDDGSSGRALNPTCTRKTCVVHARDLPPVRGKIVDRDGVPLADNRPGHDIVVTPRRLDDRKRDELIRLLALTPDEVARLDEAVKGGRRRDSGRPIAALVDQPADRVRRVVQAGASLPGIEVQAAATRAYPQRALAAHVVGYMSLLTESEVDRLRGQGYDPSGRIGRYGVERAWEPYLRGKPGRELEVVDRHGKHVDDPAALAELTDDAARVDPVPGDTVVLTLDADLQRLAEDAVAPHGAAAVAVVEVATGKLLALVSKPSFDPSIMSGSLSRADHAALLADPRKPFVDKTLRTTYAPGSLINFVTAMAALEDGVTTPAARTSCSGAHTVDSTTFRCTARHGALDLGAALQRTCHVHIWKLAEQVGIDRIAEVARNFGLGAATGLGLNGDSPGRVPTRDWYEQRIRFRIGYTLNAAIGHGDVEVTVLQLAIAYAALASGTRHRPQLVERIEDPDGKVKVPFDPQVATGWRAPAPDILALVRRSMSVTDDLAGRSATAEVRARRRPRDPPPAGWDPERSHAWFAGWAPAAAPEIAIVVLIEHGGSGPDVAAPVAASIVEGWRTTVR